MLSMARDGASIAYSGWIVRAGRIGGRRIAGNAGEHILAKRSERFCAAVKRLERSQTFR
jgi:hypothetical protein